MKSSLKWGIYAGVISGAWMYAQYYTGIYQTKAGLFTGYLFIFVLTVCVFFGVKQTRDLENGGTIDMPAAMKAGLAVSVVNGVVFSLFTYFYWLNPQPDFIAYNVGKIESYLQAKGETANNIQKAIEDFRLSTQPGKQVVQTLFGSFVFGTFSSIVMAFLLRTREKTEATS